MPFSLQTSMESKATVSVPSPVTSLGISCPDQLIRAFIEEFKAWKSPQVRRKFEKLFQLTDKLSNLTFRVII